MIILRNSPSYWKVKERAIERDVEVESISESDLAGATLPVLTCQFDPKKLWV